MTAIADGLESAADAMTTVERALPGHAASPGAFGADDEGGVPGRVGGQLQLLWSAVLDARSQEAADLARRLTDLAADVRTTARIYTETDDEAARSIRRSGRES